MRRSLTTPKTLTRLALADAMAHDLRRAGLEIRAATETRTLGQAKAKAKVQPAVWALDPTTGDLVQVA